MGDQWPMTNYELPAANYDFSSGAGALLRRMAQASTASRMMMVTQMAASVPPVALAYCTTIGAMITETRLTTLIMGFRAGPAVSFMGSPTVSPTTPAL